MVDPSGLRVDSVYHERVFDLEHGSRRAVRLPPPHDD